MRRTFIAMAALSVLTVLSCYSPAYFTAIHCDEHTGPVYNVDYYEYPPAFAREPSEWRCIRYYVSCFSGAPIAAEYAWTPSGPIRIECTFLNREEYFNAQKMITCADKSVVVGLIYRPHPTTILCAPKERTVREALELVWRQLGSYDYYEALCLDGCSVSIEVYSNRGVLRRMVLASPDDPQFGSDLVNVLSGVMQYAIKSKVSRNVYESAFYKECDSTGKHVYRDAKQALGELQQAVQNSSANEPKVKEYKRPPCEHDYVPSSQTNIDEYMNRTKGCFIIPQPLGQKEYPKP